MGIAVSSIDGSAYKKAAQFGTIYRGGRWVNSESHDLYGNFETSVQEIVKQWRQVGYSRQLSLTKL
jgi:hypothetical protein